MIQPKKTFRYTTKFVISVIAMSLAACTGTESANSPIDSPSSPASPVATSSPQATASSNTVAIPGVNNVNEISFKAAAKNSSGFFDAINGSNTQRVEIQKGVPVTASGWAILPEEGKLPDRVIITYGDNNSVVAVAPVNLERPDVLKALKSPAYKNSGWSATLDSSNLPASEVVLKAWAYNSATKEANQLGNTREIVVRN